MTTNKMSARQAVIESFIEVCSGRIAGTKTEALAILRRQVHTGTTDPGGWAKNAKVVVHLEGMVGDWCYDVECTELAFKIDEKCKERGHDIFHEYVNSAVMAFFEA